jgi:5,10-methenyltetrahydromethanopterin hydrogenase
VKIVCPQWANSGSEIVHHCAVHAVFDVTHGVLVGDDLVISQDDERLDAELMQAHLYGDRPEVMPQMRCAGGAVTRQDSIVGKIGRNLGPTSYSDRA